MNTGIIYKYTSPSGKCYIGQTIDEKRRKREHQKMQKGGCIKFYNAINKYGFENFEYVILCKIQSEDLEFIKSELNKLESEFIDKYSSFVNGYNLTTGGNSYIVSEETKKRMSESRKGYKATKEAKENMSIWQRGRKHTKEHIENFSKSRKGKGMVAINQYSLNGDFIKEWDGVSEIKEILGYDPGNITRNCKERRKSAYGYIWKYKN